MILVDTSVWIGHLRYGTPALVGLLEENLAATHPLIFGELSLGSIARRTEFISLLSKLPKISPVPDNRILAGIDQYGLFARGIGWVDAGLLLSCLTYPCRLWTLDKQLLEIAEELDIGFKPD